MFVKIKSLSCFIKSSNGRNNTGRLTSYNKGGGFKFLYYFYDNNRKVFDLPFMILKSKIYIYKSRYLDLICYKNGFLSYIKSTHNTTTNQVLLNSLTAFKYTTGDRLPLFFFVVGLCVNNIENIPLNGSVFCKASGAFGKIMCQYNKYTLIHFKSGRQRLILNKCLATVGVVSGLFNNNIKIKQKYLKAGDMRNLGRRPHVRGIAKNPVDHPNGGRTKGGSAYRDKWGNLSLGVKTRKRYNKFVLSKSHNLKLH